MIGDLAGLLIFAAYFAAVIGGLFCLRLVVTVSPELSRKTVHVLLGLGCLAFPWLFASALPVLILCALSLAGLAWMRTRRDSWRDLLHGVGRVSWGEFCYPLAVTLLFLLHRDPIPDFVIPILVLALADAVGALIGLRYGQSHYSTDEGSKSLEGSVAFFFVAFLSTHLCLLLGTETGRAESLLIAVIIGLLVMQIEAIAWRGLDNLFIPLASFLLLRAYLPMETAALAGRIALLVGIFGFFLLLRRRTYARDATLIASALVLYLLWAVGGWLWALPAVLTALVYSALCPREGADAIHRHGLPDLASICGVALFWLFLRGGTDTAGYNLPYLASWAAQIAMLVTAHQTRRRPGASIMWIGLLAGLAGLVVLLLPTLLLFRGSALAAAFPVLFAAGGLAGIVFWRLEWTRRGGTNTPGRPARQLAYALALSLLGLIPFVRLSGF
ncbi:MAG: hypothetical protein EA425_04355 [Puniceicoccaceae bacterium]|nr:MAG: hypothetical protein EA425_04355 [Puniceicoccaceae bacterium]